MAMHPLYRHKLAQRYQPQDHSQDNDAPIPWSIANDFSQLATIIDKNGFTVAICKPEHADRIIEAVNGAEKVS